MNFDLQLSLTTLDKDSKLFGTYFVLQYLEKENSSDNIIPVISDEIIEEHSDLFVFILTERGLVIKTKSLLGITE